MFSSNTPIRLKTSRLDRAKRFVRKPSEKSERSSSRKSHDSRQFGETYIKTPTAVRFSPKGKKIDFFETLATEVLKEATVRKTERMKLEQSASSEITNASALITKIKALEAQIQLKDHEFGLLSGEFQRSKLNFQEEREMRRKVENDRKQVSKEMKQVMKQKEGLEIKLRKAQKEKEYLLKQIEFLENINYDENTRKMQSYREKYLSEQLEVVKKDLNKSKSAREEELQAQFTKLAEEKFAIQSLYKAMKIANECLIKQMNQNNQDIHEIILNSEQYVRLREKYMAFLEEYKRLRNQYMTMKTEYLKANERVGDSSLFNITSSDAELSFNQRSFEHSSLVASYM